MSNNNKNKKVERDAWRNMIHRCHNPNHKAYPKYGACNIIVCDEWRSAETGFDAFYEKLGPRPGPGYSLDRVNNYGNYEPENVAWRTKSEQQKNRNPYTWRKGAGITIDGRTMSASAWHRETGVPASTILARHRTGREGSELIATGRLIRRDAGKPKGKPSPNASYYL